MSQHGGGSFHGHRKQEKQEAQKGNVELGEEEEEEEDPFDTRIKKSGCSDLHYALMVGLNPLTPRSDHFSISLYRFL